MQQPIAVPLICLKNRLFLKEIIELVRTSLRILLNKLGCGGFFFFNSIALLTRIRWLAL
jgi:hypothetical protein